MDPFVEVRPISSSQTSNLAAFEAAAAMSGPSGSSTSRSMDRESTTSRVSGGHHTSLTDTTMSTHQSTNGQHKQSTSTANNSSNTTALPGPFHATSTSSSNSNSNPPLRNPSQSPREIAPTKVNSSSSSTTTTIPKPIRSTSAAIAATYQKKSEPVYLNVYDLHPYNQYLHGLGFGAYHSAVQIFGREYSFGFHNSNETGVFSMMPKQVPNAQFRETIEAGNIYLTYNQFNIILNQLKGEWTGNKYHLLKKNCNHFSKALLAALGLKAPSFINRLASAGDMLATIVPSFMLPKQVNILIKDGRPDMSAPPTDNLRSVPSARGGVPTLSNNYNSDLNQGDWTQIAPSGPPPNYSEADSLDDESFSAFLKASEQEYERSQQYKKLQEQTRKALAAAEKGEPVDEDEEGEEAAIQKFQENMKLSAKAVAHPHSYSSTSSSLALIPDRRRADSESGPARASPFDLETDDQVEKAMAEFQLPDNVSEAEKAQIRAVLRMSISKEAR